VTRGRIGASLALLGSLALAPGDAGAAAGDSLPEFRLGPVRVRADRLPDPLGPFPLTVTRLGPEDVARLPGGTLPELVAPLAGVRVLSRGLLDVDGALSIRGSTREQVVFVVDGRRVGSPQGGGFDAASVPLEAVESVDVVRGGASALWGGDAIGGAVHVRTRPPRPGGAFRVAGGSFRERAAAGDAAFRVGSRWAVRAAGRGWATEGDFPFQDETTGVSRTVQNGDARRASGEVRADGELAGARATLDAFAFAQERGVPGSEEFPTPSARLADERFGAAAALAAPEGSWRPSADLSFARQTRRYREPDAAFGGIAERHETRRGRLELAVGRAARLAAWQACAGLGTERLDSTTDGRRARDAADLRLVASRDVARGNRVVRLLGAARLDLLEGFAPFASPRAGLAIDALPARALLAVSAGLSFRTPSFDELFWPPRASAAGNPDLRAERGRDADASLGWTAPSGAARASLGAFVREVEDLIQWIPGADGVWRPHNVLAARLSGWEAEASGTLGLGDARRLRLGASGAWLVTEDRSGEPNADGRRLPYRPRWTGSCAATLHGLGGGELVVAAHGAGDVFVTRANTKRLPGRVTLDVRARRGLGRGFVADAAATNVTGEASRDFRGYPLPGRAVSVGLSWEGGRS
jgi:outer membrane cobalamin receptor